MSKFQEFKEIVEKLSVTQENTQKLYEILGEIPNIEMYNIPDEEYNRVIDAEERQAFYESVEDEIDQLDKNLIYKGNWDSSDYFGWSRFTYVPSIDGNYSYGDIVKALRDQIPYINNNVLMTIRYYDLGSLSDYPDFKEELIDWL